jgi:hypothetical protein
MDAFGVHHGSWLDVVQLHQNLSHWSEFSIAVHLLIQSTCALHPKQSFDPDPGITQAGGRMLDSFHPINYTLEKHHSPTTSMLSSNHFQQEQTSK